jgi:hypothetical protein
MNNPLNITLRDVTLIQLVLAIATGSSLAGFLSTLGLRIFAFTDHRFTQPAPLPLASAVALVVCGGLLLLAARGRPALDD